MTIIKQKRSVSLLFQLSSQSAAGIKESSHLPTVPFLMSRRGMTGPSPFFLFFFLAKGFKQVAKHQVLWRSMKFIFGQLIMLGRSTGVSLAVVTFPAELRTKSQREHLQLLPKVISFLFFRCFVKQPGFKNLTRVTSRDILLRLSWVTVHQVRGARCCPRGGSTLSHASHNKAGPQQRAQAARKKKKKNLG